MNRMSPTRTAVAMAVIASLSKMPEHKAIAAQMSLEDAARLHGRWQRSLWSGSDKRNMPPAELDRKSRQRRRARQTHPGKRGRA